MPAGTEVWPSGSAQNLGWTVSPAVDTGQFGVWLVYQTTGAWYAAGYYDAVPGQTAYAPSFSTTGVPAGSYKAVVYYRTDPTQWVWQANAMSPGAATVTEAAPAPPEITELSVSPASFYGGAGATGHTTLTYVVDRAATVSAVVKNAAGTTVRTLRPPTAQQAGGLSLDWDGTGDGGSSLPEGAYTVVVAAGNEAGGTSRSAPVDFALTPVASQASLAVGAGGGYVLHTVVERWSETLNGQGTGDFYFDGLTQPWEFAARSGAALTLYVGTDGGAQQDTTSGGSVSASTNTQGVADLAFPGGLSWTGPGGAPRALYYSLRLTYGGSSRWYPSERPLPLRAPTTTDGHLKFAFISDIQTPRSAVPTPNLVPSDLDAAHGAYGPYSAIPRLSRSRAWSEVLSSLRGENDVNLVVSGGDLVDLGSDGAAADDGETQFRSLFDNRQSFGAAPEWSLGSLTSRVAFASAPGNHDAIDSASVAARWSRWVYSSAGLPYSAFDRGDVHFVLLDNFYASTTPATNYRGWIGFQSPTVGGSRSVTVGGTRYTFTNSAQADWLLGALATSKPWTVVAMHYPMLDGTTSGAYSQANQTGTVTTTNMYYYGERDRLLAYFARHGVDVVLQGHTHYYRRHLEKLHNQSGVPVTTQTYVTNARAGGPPTNFQKDSVDTALPFLDWVDVNGNGVPDGGEPLMTSADDYWDAGYFGERNSPADDSGYFGTPDTYHPTGEEYDNGLSFSYSVFSTGSDAGGHPTLTMTVRRIAWNAPANTWNPWTVYETVQIPQVDGDLVAARLDP